MTWLNNYNFIPEHPDRDNDDDHLADRIIAWIGREQRPPGLEVGALYGARGQGKTSTLFHIVTRVNRLVTRVNRRQLITLPNSPLFNYHTAAKDDEVFADLLCHLEGYPGTDRGTCIQEIREQQARRFKRDAFIQLAIDESPTDTQLAKRLAETSETISAVTATTRNKLKEFLSPQNNEGVFLILIDDFDVQPKRALELVKTLLTYFDLDDIRLTILLAADRQTLGDALAEGSKLAWPILKKLISVEFHLEGWDVDRAFKERLWRDDCPLKAIWPRYRDEIRDEIRETGETQESFAKSVLKSLLPTTPRGINRFHNRVITLAAELRGPPGPVDVWLDRAKPYFATRFECEANNVIAFRLGVIAADERHPPLGLETLAKTNPSSLIRLIRELSASGSADDASRTAQKSPEEVIEQHLGKIALSGPNRADAIQTLLALARYHALLLSGGAESQVSRFLALSLNADALATSTEIWAGTISEEHRWHIDLQSVRAADRRATPDELQEARRQLGEQITELGIADHLDPLQLVSRAQFSVVMWLGWRLHRLRQITVFNLYGGQITPYHSPTEPYRYSSGILFNLEVLNRQAGEGSSARVIVDLLGKTTDSALNDFPDTLHSAPGWVVGRPIGSPRLTPSDLETIVFDLVEFLGDLRHGQGIQTIHLGWLGPDVFAFFLGRELHEVGQFTLYEYYGEGYQPVFDLSDV